MGRPTGTASSVRNLTASLTHPLDHCIHYKSTRTYEDLNYGGLINYFFHVHIISFRLELESRHCLEIPFFGSSCFSSIVLSAASLLGKYLRLLQNLLSSKHNAHTHISSTTATVSTIQDLTLSSTQSVMGES